MKRIKFKLLQNEDAVKSDGAEPIFVLNSKPYSEANEQIAKAEAYNGEYTIEDDGKPEPVIPPTNGVLAEENKLLKAQMEMQAQNITFLENCLLEMGDIVYA